MTLPTPKALVAEALECAPETLTETSALARHPKWDSFGHLNIMLRLEQHYGVEITDATIRRFESLTAIEALYAELGARNVAE
jgi:acyl carrier protein